MKKKKNRNTQLVSRIKKALNATNTERGYLLRQNYWTEMILSHETAVWKKKNIWVKSGKFCLLYNTNIQYISIIRESAIW